MKSVLYIFIILGACVAALAGATDESNPVSTRAESGKYQQ